MDPIENKREDELKSENDFLKMKMMLENGAEFHVESDKDLPANLENLFLKHVMEFEKQFAERKTIKVFDKIGCPTQFKPGVQLSDEEIPAAWAELCDYLKKHSISLSACSPNVTERQLYEFTLGELFDYEMDDMDIPGMMHGFIYDEFHPDPHYDNQRMAVDYGIRFILRKHPLEWMHGFQREELRLNEHYPLSAEDFQRKVNLFKESYEKFGEAEVSNVQCTLRESSCIVIGVYAVPVHLPDEIIVLAGNWTVELSLDEDLGYWFINTVLMEGIRF